jgi:hypothetical protein
LDTEWLLSTLFDASLLSTLKPPETAALFLRVFGRIGPARLRVPATFAPMPAFRSSCCTSATSFRELRKAKGTGFVEGAGNHKLACGWTLRPRARNDLFIIFRLPSAAYLKFLHRKRRIPSRNFK